MTKKQLLLDFHPTNGKQPSSVFKDSEMNFTASIRSKNKSKATGSDVGVDIPFEVRMHFEDSPHQLFSSGKYFEVSNKNQNDLVVNGETGESPIIKIKMLRCSGKKNVVLQACPVGDITSAPSLSITPVSTRPMRVVRYRLVISNALDIKRIWFRDMGGKDNHIAVKVRLVNSIGETVTTRHGVLLNLQLCYENGDVVSNQDILNIHPGQNMFLGKDGGATIMFRIECVSSKHERKLFSVAVHADNIPEDIITTNGDDDYDDDDIMFARSPAILVRSKITNENLQKKVKKQQKIEEKMNCVSNAFQCAGGKRKYGNVSPNTTTTENISMEPLKSFAIDAAQTLWSLQDQLQDSSHKAAVEQILAKYEALSPHYGTLTPFVVRHPPLLPTCCVTQCSSINAFINRDDAFTNPHTKVHRVSALPPSKSPRNNSLFLDHIEWGVNTDIPEEALSRPPSISTISTITPSIFKEGNSLFLINDMQSPETDQRKISTSSLPLPDFDEEFVEMMSDHTDVDEIGLNMSVNNDSSDDDEEYYHFG